MDEFDKIREISEDLTHRREPTFTQLGKTNSIPNSNATNPQNNLSCSEQSGQTDEKAQRIQNIHSFLNQPATAISDSDNAYKFTGNFNDKIDFVQMDEALEKKSFPSMKLHLIGITVFVGILGIVLAGFFFWGGNQDNINEIITITTAPTVIKESPAQAGGMNIPDQDKLVYNRIRSDNVTTKVESLFPEPEKPVIPQILAIEENTQEEEFVKMNNVKAVNPLDEPEKPLIVADKQVNQPATIPDSDIKTPTQPKIETTKTEQPKPTILPLEKSKPEQKAAIPVKQPTIQEAKNSGNIWRAQLFASNNKPAVEKAWKRILNTHKSLLSDMSYEIESAEIKGKGIFYRLKVGQFASRDMAAALCAKLKAKKQDCVPTK